MLGALLFAVHFFSLLIERETIELSKKEDKIMLKRKKDQTRNMVAAIQSGKIANEELKRLFEETVNFCDQSTAGWKGVEKDPSCSFSKLYLEV